MFCNYCCCESITVFDKIAVLDKRKWSEEILKNHTWHQQILKAVGVKGPMTLEIQIWPPLVATVDCLNTQWQKPHCIPGETRTHIHTEFMHTHRHGVTDISLILRQFKCMGWVWTSAVISARSMWWMKIHTYTHTHTCVALSAWRAIGWVYLHGILYVQHVIALLLGWVFKPDHLAC